jgi:GTP:adenosylcobinamide-phosphate guanylyltransferase
MNAIVTAGGIPQPGEPLYEFTQGGSKALLDIAGKPMIQWVLDALDGAKTVDQVVIIGLGEDSKITSSKLAAFIPNQGGMVDNIRAGVNKVLEIDPGAMYVVAASSDVPGITSEMVEWLVTTAMETQDEAYYCVIPRQVMEKRYPDSRRTYTRLKDMELCGGDVNIIKTSLVTQNDELWDKLVAARKNVIKQAALIGYDTLFLLLFRMVTLDQGIRKVTKRLKISGRALVSPYAEIGMDVDKPFQLEIMRADLAQRVKV